MKLHYKGKYDFNPDSLPHGEHQPNAVPFREAKDSKTMGLIANILSFMICVLLAVPAYFRCRDYWNLWQQLYLGCICSLLAMFPHEILHAVCFKKDAYLYTNWKQGMLFVVGPETMSKSRFVFMSFLPNLIFGVIPYLIGMMFPKMIFLLSLGIFSTAAGAGDYYNIFNALTQMPKGARTYLYKFNSYWYLPECEN